MPDDLLLADLLLTGEFIGFLAALALAARGVWKLDLRWLAGGAAVLCIVWLLAAGSNPGEWTRHELISLRLRPVDAVGGELVRGAAVMAVEPGESAPSARCRLPCSCVAAGDRPTDGRPSDEALIVSLVVELRLDGSLLDLRRRPAAHTELVDQRLEIVAAGYRRWRGELSGLLPDGWPATPLSQRPIEIRLERE